MRGLWNRLVTRAALALAPFLPTSQTPFVPGVDRWVPVEPRHDKFDESEVDVACFAAHSDNGERYDGPRRSIQDDLDALTNAKGRGRRFLNAALLGSEVAREREAFIAARTVDE